MYYYFRYVVNLLITYFISIAYVMMFYVNFNATTIKKSKNPNNWQVDVTLGITL